MILSPAWECGTRCDSLNGKGTPMSNQKVLPRRAQAVLDTSSSSSPSPLQHLKHPKIFTADPAPLSLLVMKCPKG